MTISVVNIERVRGDTMSFTVTLTDNDGDPLVITGNTFLLTANECREPNDDQLPQFQLTGTIVTDGTGVTSAVVSFSPTAGQADYAGVLYYDMEMTTSAGVILTVMRGTYTLIGDITKTLSRTLTWDADGQSDGDPVGKDVLAAIHNKDHVPWPAAWEYDTAQKAAGKTSSAYLNEGGFWNQMEIGYFPFWDAIKHDFVTQRGTLNLDMVLGLRVGAETVSSAVLFYCLRSNRYAFIAAEVHHDGTDTVSIWWDDDYHGGGGYDIDPAVIPGGVDVSRASGLWYWMRIRKVANLFSIRVWQDGTAEPATWAIEDWDMQDPGLGGGGILTENLPTNSITIYIGGSAPPELWVQELQVTYS